MAHEPGTLRSSFLEAIDSFMSKSGLTSKELFDMKMTTLLDLQKALAVIQKEQRNTKTQRFLGRLQPFLDAMQQYSQVINIFANTSDIIAFIWGPMKFLLVIASNFTEAFNAMLEGYLTIGESLPQLEQYQELFGSNQYMRSALASIFEDILDFHAEAVKYFKQRTWKQLYHATSRGLNTRIEYLTKSLQRHKNIVESQASLEEYRRFQEFRTEIKSDLARLEMSERDRQQVRVQQWLAPVNTATRHENAARERFCDTGKWLLQKHHFQSWFSSDQCIDPLLWLHGIPGAGKTVLASLVVDEARKYSSATTTCFYCKSTDEQRNGFLTIAKSLLSQIALMQDLVLHYLYEEASKSNEAVLSTTAVAKGLLEVALNSCQKVYIVLDGLDEYSRDDRKELTSWFQNLISSLPKADLGAIRCLFISQEDGFARKDLGMLSQIKVTPADNTADIEAFCSEWHEKIESKFGVLERKEHNVKRVVSARAQGMFLLAKLVTWNLYEQTSRVAFEAEIDPDRFPDGLDQAIMERLLGAAVRPRARVSSIRMLLGWLACARRPLKWYEIQGAVAVDLEEGEVSARYKFREDCKDLCASLVEISSDQTVTLVHATTKGYLIRNEHIQVSDIEYDMATRCCMYLGLPDFEIGRHHSEIEKAIMQGTYAFADYAVCFWALHLEAAVSESGKLRSDRLSELAEHLEAFLDLQWENTDKTYVISNTLSEHLISLRRYEFFDKTCQAVAAAKSWLRPTAKAPIGDDVLRIPRVVKHIRTVLEHLTVSPTTTKETKCLIEDLYGPCCYKCNRMSCQYFHRGFDTGRLLEQHVSKHERSFICIEQGCFYEIIGFTSEKDLNKHVLDFHGIEIDRAELKFPEDPPRPTPTLVTQTKAQPQMPNQPTVNKCDLCNKTYTRSYNLRSHLRTHANERPFICTECGKAFARQHDRNRHESLHSGKRNFVCRGELPSMPGKHWGCGKRFGRAEGLVIHLRSEAGRMCIRPLLDEEAAKQQKDQAMSHGTQPNSDPDLITHKEAGSEGPIPLQTSEPAFPEEVLRLYPGVRDTDWSQVPLGEGPTSPSAELSLNEDVFDDDLPDEE